MERYRGLEPRPTAWKAAALPDELVPQCLHFEAGVLPAEAQVTPGSEIRRRDQVASPLSQATNGSSTFRRSECLMVSGDPYRHPLEPEPPSTTRSYGWLSVNGRQTV